MQSWLGGAPPQSAPPISPGMWQSPRYSYGGNIPQYGPAAGAGGFAGFKGQMGPEGLIRKGVNPIGGGVGDRSRVELLEKYKNWLPYPIG